MICALAVGFPLGDVEQFSRGILVQDVPLAVVALGELIDIRKVPVGESAVVEVLVLFHEDRHGPQAREGFDALINLQRTSNICPVPLGIGPVDIVERLLLVEPHALHALEEGVVEVDLGGLAREGEVGLGIVDKGLPLVGRAFHDVADVVDVEIEGARADVVRGVVIELASPAADVLGHDVGALVAPLHVPDAVVVVVGVELRGDADLAHALQADNLLSAGAGLAESGQQNADQQRDDRDHDQKLDQCEAPPDDRVESAPRRLGLHGCLPRQWSVNCCPSTAYEKYSVPDRLRKVDSRIQFRLFELELGISGSGLPAFSGRCPASRAGNRSRGPARPSRAGNRPA